MATTPIEAFLDTLTTEDAALDAINAIRQHFDFTGITFTADDVASMADSVLAWHNRDFSDAFFSAVIKTVQNGREYRDLGNLLVEHGNETLDDAVARTVGLLEDGNGYEYGAQLLVERDGALVAVVERQSFPTATTAFHWAREYVGLQALDAIGEMADPVSLPGLLKPGAMVLTVAQVGLVVRREGEQVATFVSHLG